MTHTGRPVEMAAPRLLADASPTVLATGDRPGLASLEQRLRRVDDLEAREPPRLVRWARVPVAAAALGDPDTVEVVVGTRSFIVPIEVDDYPDSAGQRYCDPRPKPGAVLLAELLVEAHPTSGSMGIARPCELGSTSEHKEGRGFDWDVTSLDARVVDLALVRLLASDRQGNSHALARRMGITYMIWNDQIWSSRLADQGWRTYTGPHSHRDHVHFSLSWAGALGHTTLWQAAADEGWLEPMPSVDQVLGGLTLWTPPPEPSPEPTPTPSPTPTPAATPKSNSGSSAPTTPPSPSPSSSPTTRPSPSTSPSSSPSTSPSPTSPSSPPTTSPAPVPSPTATPSPTPSATSSPAPTEGAADPAPESTSAPTSGATPAP